MGFSHAATPKKKLTDGGASQPGKILNQQQVLMDTGPAAMYAAGFPEDASEQAYQFDEIDELEYKYAVEEGANFQPSPELVQSWDSFKHKQDKVFYSQNLDSILKTNFDSLSALPDQCTDQVRKWNKAITPKESTPPNPAWMKQHPECRDPWTGKAMCQKSFEIPSYRLSDLIRYRPPGFPQYTSIFFPLSIGAKYEEKMNGAPPRRPGPEPQQIKKLNEVLNDKMYDDFDKPSPTELVIHLRLGDSYASMQRGNGYYVGKLEKAKKLNISSVTLIFGDHKIQQIAVLNGRNASEAKPLQKAFNRIEEVQRLCEKHGFKVDKRVNFNTDCDIIYMANAKYFVKAGGGFSHLMDQLVHARGGQVL